MNELKGNQKHRPPNKVRDAASLNSLLGFLNNPAITGAAVPKGAIVNASVVESPGAAAIIETPTVVRPTPPAPVSTPAAAPVASLNRVFLTGRFKVGKDFAAAAAGCKILNAADPIYFLAGYFFGNRPKDETRAFLQAAGQYGRGTISAEYPLTVERACFIEAIRKASKNWSKEAVAALCVDWSSYGKNENIWLDSLVARAKSEPAGTKIAISGVRFANEHARLSKEGFVHFHCMASAATWSERLKKAGLTPESPATKDISEQLAAALDQNVIKTLSHAKQGAKLRCVWSDDKQPSPSQRLLSISDFIALFRTS